MSKDVNVEEGRKLDAALVTLGESMTPEDKARLLTAVQDVGLVFPVQAGLADRAVHTILHLRACVEAQNAKVRHYQRSVEGARARVTEVDEARAKITQALQVLRVTMEDMGYVCDPNPDTTPAEALRVIRRLHDGNENLRSTLRERDELHTKTLAELERAREALAATTANPESPWPSQQGIYELPRTVLEQMALMVEDVLTAGGGPLSVRVNRACFSMNMRVRDAGGTPDEEAAVLKGILAQVYCASTPESAETILRAFSAKNLPPKRPPPAPPTTAAFPIEDVRALVGELRLCGETAFEESPLWLAAYRLRRLRKDFAAMVGTRTVHVPHETHVTYNPRDRAWLFDGTAEKLSGWPPATPSSEEKPAEGRKDDSAKLRYDLLDPGALAWLVAGMTYGAAKYAPDNWRKVEGWRWRYVGALLRHVMAYQAGVHEDVETGLPHLALAMCCVLMLLGREKYGDQETATRYAQEAIRRWRASVAKAVS